MKLKIAIVVHGRFHAFDLAQALLARGHDVALFTNYPKWAVAGFGFPKERVRSFWIHGVLSRGNEWLHREVRFPYFEADLHRMFGQWAVAELCRKPWDVIHPWSGIAEEILNTKINERGLRMLMRGSAHIRTQTQLLEEEEGRTGMRLDKPSPWMIAREEREYGLADAIVVLSRFAYETFRLEGVPVEKLRLLPLGTRLDHFRPRWEVVQDRVERILTGRPLRVLHVGALSFQKGLWDLAGVIRKLRKGPFQFRLVGPLLPEAVSLRRALAREAEWLPKRTQHHLPEVYAWADIFIFPTIQDGYAQVLAQAAASGLPILTTPNCSGPDLIRDGETGWILPIRAQEAFIERLLWCNTHRQELAAMVEQIYRHFQPRDWGEVARDFELLCVDSLGDIKKGKKEWKPRG